MGRNSIERTDRQGGITFRKEIQRIALSEGSGWVSYEYENPINGGIEPKTTFVQRVDDIILCAGAYRSQGRVVAMFGVDIDAREWKMATAKAAAPTIALTLALILILLIGATLLGRRIRPGERAPRRLRHLGPAFAMAMGLALTVFGAWTAHLREDRARDWRFAQLAASRTDTITGTLRNLRDTGLEEVAGFIESSGDVTLEEFSRYTHYLTRNPAVRAWGSEHPRRRSGALCSAGKSRRTQRRAHLARGRPRGPGAGHPKGYSLSCPFRGARPRAQSAGSGFRLRFGSASP